MSRHHSTRLRDDSGFTIVESIVALTVVFVVLLGLLSALTAGVKGVVTGRQRSAALALANEVLEKARGRGYAEVGHDLDSDPTLAGDPLITVSGTPAVPRYNGEPLAASITDAGPQAGTTSNPLFPFSPHTFTTMRENTTYTTTVYVTTVTPGTGDSYKRITTSVTWRPNQYATAARSVALSTFLFDLKPPPDPRLVGEGDADSGFFQVTGVLEGTDLKSARISLPYATGTVDSGFVRTAKGFGQSARSEVLLNSGTLSGCSVGLLRADCPPAKAETRADNDSGSSPPEFDQAVPGASLGGTITVGSALSSILGTGTAESLATGRSCWSCSGSLGPDDDDGLPYQNSKVSGPASMSMGFKAGAAAGSLVAAPVGCAADCAVVSADRDDVSGSARMTTTASATYPAIDVVTFTSPPVGYTGMVKIGSARVTATASSGPGAPSPTVSSGALLGGPVVVQLYDPSIATGYRNISIDPTSGSAGTDSSHAEFSVGGAYVVMDATVNWNPAVVSSTSASGALTSASASLTSWLWIEVRLQITQGPKVADLTLHLDYGKVSASATYEAA